jgi:hypothetical protein
MQDGSPAKRVAEPAACAVGLTGVEPRIATAFTNGARIP